MTGYVRDAKINYYEKSPTTIPAPVIPFEDDPEYHDDDGDDTFGLLEHKTSADEVAAAAFIIVLTKKKTVGAPCLGIFWELTGSTKPFGALTVFTTITVVIQQQRPHTRS